MNTESQTLRGAKKIIVLGLDGVPLSLLQYLTESNIMPNLKAILQKGAYGNLRSVMPPVTPAAWTSFQTGTYPYRHGVIDFVTFTPWTCEFSFSNSTHISGQTIWSLLNAADIKQIVVNVPLTYPPEEINGIIIPGFDTPQTERTNSAHPEGILDEIERTVGEYPFLSLHKSIRLHRDEGLKALGDNLIELTRSQVNAVHYLAKTYPWDFLMYHFQVTDIMQHSAWDVIEPGLAPGKDKEDNTGNKDVVHDFYRSIDSMAGEIIDRYGQDATVCLLSDHGFTAYNTTVYLNLFLKEMGYISFNTFYPLMEARDALAKISGRLHIPLLKYRQLPPGRKVNRTFQRIDFRRSKAYGYSNSLNYAFLFVNKNFQVDMERLKKDLMGLRHEGKPVVEGIYPWYEGRSTDSFNPDFVVEFHKGYSIKHRLPSRRHIKGYPLFEATMAHGNHSIDGFFCISGDNIKNNHESSAEIVDVMPTLLNILKVAIPNGIDGTLMEDVFITSSESEFTDSSHLSKTHKTVGDENFDAVADMLKSLGYLQ